MSAALLKQLSSCQRCPRLAAHNQEIAKLYPTYHAAPVGAWGDPRARLSLLGLAPGLHGAARTGRAFVGDASGHFLFAALHRAGLATAAEPEAARLVGARITNVVKCLPPGNAPKSCEINHCRDYLEAELGQWLPRGGRAPRVLLTLGGVAHRALCKTLAIKAPRFAHGTVTQIQPKLFIISSFHPSRLNVNTGRLTAAMLDEVLGSAQKLL